MKQFLLTLTNIIKVSLMFVKQFYSNTICFFNGDLMRAISGLIAVENDSGLLLAPAIPNGLAPMAE